MSARRIIAPVMLVAGLFGTWELAAQNDLIADALDLKPYLVPAPSEIATSLYEDRGLLGDNAWITFQEVLAGFALSIVIGTVLAAAMHFSTLLRDALRPLVVASQTIPIIVIAPVLTVWFGYGIAPKLAIIALICFFPITVNTLDGLTAVDPAHRKLMRTLHASRWQTFRRVEAPAALPYFFTGAKIAVAVAVIGAVFGEFAGSDSGLGHLMQLSSGQLQTARTFAAMAVLSAFAITLFAVVALLERKLAWWGEQPTT